MSDEQGRPELYYDIGELGWSMYLAAHMKYLSRNGRPAAVSACHSKQVFYRDCTLEFLPLPESWTAKYGGYPSDGHHLYNPRTGRRLKDHTVLSAEFVSTYPQYSIVTSYGRFTGETLFEPYSHSPEMEKLSEELFGSKKLILVFPRRRSSKFRGRNISRNLWLRIIRALCDRYPGLLVVSLGSVDGAFGDLDPGRPNFRDMVGYDDGITLDLMVALCNAGGAAAAVGNQSGTVKITLLCGTPTYIIGHEKKRHTVDENWSGTRAGFFEVGSIFGPRLPFDRKAGFGGYRIWNPGKLVREIVSFMDETLETVP